MSSKQIIRDHSPKREVKKDKHSSRKVKVKHEEQSAKHGGVKVKQETRSLSPSGTVKPEACSSGSESSTNSKQLTYKIYSERRKRYLGKPAFKKHDKVVTNAGIHGTVVALDEDTVTLRVDEKNNVRIRFSRSAIWQVQTDDEAKPAGVPEK